MRNFHLLTLVAVALLGVACDPYDDLPGGDARVLYVHASSGLDLTSAQATGPDWTITDAVSICDADTGIARLAQASVWVTLNKQIDGATVQSTVNSCEPTGDWLVASATPTGLDWYSCYSPASPSPNDGGSIVMFLAPAVSDGGTAADPSDDVAAAAGWASAYDDHHVPLTPADGDVVTTYTLSGALLDNVGVGTITVNVAPNPGDVDVNIDPEDDNADSENLTFTPGTTTMVVSWSPAACGTAATRYRVERAPNVPGDDAVDPADDEPGDYVEIATDLADVTFTDTGLTAGTKYWYTVTALTSTGYEGDPVEDFATTTAAP